MSEAIQHTIDTRAEGQARRKHNRERSCGMLRYLGVDFDVKNDGAHLVVRHNGKTVDFWPGTGKYIPREPKPKHGRGVFNLLQMLGISTNTKQESDQ